MREPTPPPRLASDEVHLLLRQQILDGELAAGDAVPSERLLSEALGVNRHAVREALKRLQQAGLVRIVQGGATRVLDWRDSGGLEVLLDLMDRQADPPPELIRAVLEMRAGIGIDAARRCAVRAGDRQRHEIGGHAASTAAAVDAGDGSAIAHFIELWRAIVDGSGNLAYRLGLNSLNGALDAYPELAEALSPRDAMTLRSLGEAIAAGDADGAAAAARRLLEADIDAAG